MKKVGMLCLVLGLIVIGTACTTMRSPAVNLADLSSVDFTQPFKRGESCSTSVLGFQWFGDASIVEAAKSAGITTVQVVDYDFRYYVVMHKFCTIVHGK